MVNKMIKINMIGGGFQHDVCSSAMNQNKYVTWVKDKSANISIHIDNALGENVDPNTKNYGWMAESSSVISNIVESAKVKLEEYRNKFELVFTHDKRIVEIDPSFYKFVIPNCLPWIRNKKIYEKSKNVSFIVSSKNFTNGHRYRLSVLQKYSNGEVDHFGRGFTNELPWSVNFNGIEENGKIQALKDYRFSFAFENDNYESIFCEKITDCFATGTIPIFWGTPDIGNYFDTEGIITYDENFDIQMLNEEYYLSKIRHIRNNFEICLNLDSSEDYIYLNYLK